MILTSNRAKILLSQGDNSQTLTHLTKTLPQKRGIDKNLFIKKFVKNIIYSPSQIQINLNCFKDISIKTGSSFLGVGNHLSAKVSAGLCAVNSASAYIELLRTGESISCKI